MTMAAPSNHLELKFPANFKLTGITSITGKNIPVMLELGKHTMATLIQEYITQKLYKYIYYGEAINDPSQFLFRGFSPEDMNNPDVLTATIASKTPLQLIHISMAPKAREPSHSYGSDTVTVKTLTGKSIKINCDIPIDTVAQLKAYVADSEGCPEDQQRLIYNGKQLEDVRLLNDYNIKTGDDVHMVLRLRGGMFSEVSGVDGGYLENTPLVLMKPTWFPNAKPAEAAKAD